MEKYRRTRMTVKINLNQDQITPLASTRSSTLRYAYKEVRAFPFNLGPSILQKVFLLAYLHIKTSFRYAKYTSIKEMTNFGKTGSKPPKLQKCHLLICSVLKNDSFVNTRLLNTNQMGCYVTMSENNKSKNILSANDSQF